jgi:3-hydroxyacyl-[acyl-carrier-protein] dehydratase
MSTASCLDFDQVRAQLPQTYPFILIDRVLELVPQQRIVASKNITGNEWIFAAHFPTRAIYPGVLLLESMAQAAILLFKAGAPESSGTFLLTGVRSRFLHVVVPGDHLLITCTPEKMISNAAIVAAEISLAGKQTTVAKANLTFAFQPGNEDT